jgi:hypothetical protein
MLASYTRAVNPCHAILPITCDSYGHWIPGEGRAGLEAALAGGTGKGSGEGEIVPFSVP